MASDAVWIIRNETQGVEDTAAGWGIRGLQRMLQNQAMDTISFVCDGALMDSPQEFNYGDIVIVTRDATRWFYGLVTKISVSAASGGESISYEVSGPYWWLANREFEQEWATHDRDLPWWPPQPLGSMIKTRCNLNQRRDGTIMSTGEQIREVLLFAISKGAKFSIGDIDPDVKPRCTEVLDQMCSEVINQQLRWTPDCVVFFDYTETPYPRIHIRSRANMLSVSKPLTTQLAEGLTVTPRHDLQIPGVYIAYEREDQADEASWSTVVRDEVGADTFCTVKMTVELGGGQSSNQRQDLVSQGLDPRSPAFWIAKNPWLEEATDLVIEDGATNGVGGILAPASELVQGAIPSWLAHAAGPGEATAKLSYKILNADGAGEEVVQRVFNYKFTRTTLGTGSYSRLQSYTLPEAVPVGVAAAFYAAANFLHFEGTVSFTEAECRGDVRPGLTLNLAGGKAVWSSMEAIVQQVTEDIDLGQTQVSFGPPGHITITDFIELLRIQRGSRPSWRLQERVDGIATGGKAESRGPSDTPNSSVTDAGAGQARIIVAKAPVSGPVYKIDLNPADITAVGSVPGDMKPRPIRCCAQAESGGPMVPGKMMVLCGPFVPDVGGGGGGV